MFPESRWLFTRGVQSVRLVREEDATRWRLSVLGPGTEVVIQEFASMGECMSRQGDVEQRLLAEGFQIERAPSERRRDHGMWHGADPRRAAG